MKECKATGRGGKGKINKIRKKSREDLFHSEIPIVYNIGQGKGTGWSG